AQGSLKDILESKESLTGKYLSGKLSLPDSKLRKKTKGHEITLHKASHHNLKQVTVSIPLGLFVSITGVSGSGKSSLILDTLFPILSNKIQDSFLPIGAYESIEGCDKIDKVIAIDQSPIGRTPRSNPATYIKLFDEIRDLFTQLPDSQSLGFAAGRFSFNVKEGCCPFCLGMGMIKVDMDFLADEWSLCDVCKGKRFDDTTLSICFKGKNIHDVLEMSIEEAYDFFSAQPKIRNKLDLLMKVGLDYIKLGQPSPTLSGGEAQRIKLAKELSRPSTGKTLYILDEPTTGLHFHDVNHLAKILHSLVDKGNTVLVIEHNMDLVKTSDWIIDLGPEAGSQGGEILGEGTPIAIAKQKTPTGIALKEALSKKNLLSQKPLSHTTQPLSHLIIKNAEQNNLKGLDIKIPLGAITVCTGPSGSGKSSLAFETIYAEGQRRYIESMSHYARQFVKQMLKPKVEQIEGLSAAIAIEQKNHAGNPRSTVGTMTEIYDYLRILYSHLGTPFCPETGEEIKSISKEYVVNKAMELPLKSKCFILCPITLSKQETFEQFKEKMVKKGFIRIRLNGVFFELEDSTIPWDPKKKNALCLVIDR
ncbi:MAG: excinuclease ABC subunit A, partial [Verrucomicrobia bacterium]|nr:excinuclease ABC subunit A [Verrucomicrobiota bacterium]